MTCETVDVIHLGLGSIQWQVLVKAPMDVMNTLINPRFTLMNSVNTLTNSVSILMRPVNTPTNHAKTLTNPENMYTHELFYTLHVQCISLIYKNCYKDQQMHWDLRI
jgi:hypothetical protein